MSLQRVFGTSLTLLCLAMVACDSGRAPPPPTSVTAKTPISTSAAPVGSAPVGSAPSSSGAVGFGIGDVAPEIIGTDQDGEEFKLSDYRGKVVVLDFWGNW